MENYHLIIHMSSWKESMINRLSNLINRNRSAAKISQVLCSTVQSTAKRLFWRNIFQSSQKYYKGPRPVQTELFRELFSSTLLGPNVHSNDPPFIALPRPALH